MSGAKLPLQSSPAAPAPVNELDLQTADLMEMVALLGPRDVSVLVAIMRHAAEVSETQGEDMAVAVLDQLEGILKGRTLDA
jgi:class 3 adenylate cyclase